MPLSETLCEKWKASRLGQVVFARYIVIGMGFLVMIFNYALRVNINMTLVAMVKNRPPKNDTTYSGECGHHEIDEWGAVEPEPASKGGEFDWDETRQTLIISAFFWGYIWTQIPGGKLGQRFGGKRVVALSILSTAICNLFVPIAARASYIYVILLRVGMGLSEGVIYPASICLITNYALPSERSRFNAIFTAGAEIGSVFAMPFAGILIANYGWEAVFYVFGGAGICFVFLWMLLVYDSPNNHPYITDGEKLLLHTSLSEEMAQNRKTLPVPWRALLTSVPVWTATYVMAASGWSYSVMLSLTPTYLKNMMNYDITKTGIMSGLPYLLMYGFSVLFSYFIDMLRSKQFCTVSTLRKIANVVSQMGQGVCLIILSFSGCSEVIALILINTSGLVYGATYSGHLAVPLDLSPNFSGIIYAFNNLGFTFLAMLGPLISGIIITGHQTLAKWALVFRIAAAINISNVILFTIFGSAEVQPWNDVGIHRASAEDSDEEGGKKKRQSSSSSEPDNKDGGAHVDQHEMNDIVAMAAVEPPEIGASGAKKKPTNGLVPESALTTSVTTTTLVINDDCGQDSSDSSDDDNVDLEAVPDDTGHVNPAFYCSEVEDDVDPGGGRQQCRPRSGSS